MALTKYIHRQVRTIGGLSTKTDNTKQLFVSNFSDCAHPYVDVTQTEMLTITTHHPFAIHKHQAEGTIAVEQLPVRCTYVWQDASLPDRTSHPTKERQSTGGMRLLLLRIIQYASSKNPTEMLFFRRFID